MKQTAKVFQNGRSQAVRLPLEFRFKEKEVYIRQDPETGDIILSAKPENWDGFLAAIKEVNAPEDFLGDQDRSQTSQARDPFEGWTE